MTILAHAEVLELATAAVAAGLALERRALLGQLDPDYAASLALSTSPKAQLLQDLSQMNQVGQLLDGSVPLTQWLAQAAFLAGSKPQSAVFRAALARAAERVDQSRSAPPPGLLEESLEQVFFVDDRLDIAFFARALEAGAKVARLTVPIFEGGVRKMNNAGGPVSGFGTGWLCGAGGLLMTNNHVIRARANKTEVVSDADLQAQLAGALVEFDYEEGRVAHPCGVASLVARDPDLDFAVLQLDAAHPGRGGLVLQTRLIDLSEGVGGPNDRAYVPVNIIQHPDGLPKQAAFRNNLVTRSTDQELRYFTDTEAGASGSPVCNDRWQVVALHRASGPIGEVTNFQGKRFAHSNIGTQMAAIVSRLKADAALWAQLEPRLGFA